MQKGKWMSERETVHQVIRAALGIVLFMLVVGVWACLWIPPSL
jgi:hypothetical protein